MVATMLNSLEKGKQSSQWGWGGGTKAKAAALFLVAIFFFFFFPSEKPTLGGENK